MLAFTKTVLAQKSNLMAHYRVLEVGLRHFTTPMTELYHLSVCNARTCLCQIDDSEGLHQKN